MMPAQQSAFEFESKSSSAVMSAPGGFVDLGFRTSRGRVRMAGPASSCCCRGAVISRGVACCGRVALCGCLLRLLHTAVRHGGRCCVGCSVFFARKCANFAGGAYPLGGAIDFAHLSGHLGLQSN